MQFIIETVPNDIALMFATYLGFCLLLMYLFIRADSEWNQREMILSRERMRVLSNEHEKNDRMCELAACSVHHDVDCACFLRGLDSKASMHDSVPASER